jgi:hypothetical protein
LLHDIVEGANSEVLARKITFPLDHEVKKATRVSSKGTGDAEVEPIEEGRTPADEPDEDDDDDSTDVDHSDDVRVVSLSHVMTNIVILQEFILELAAVMQVRASMFGEVFATGP